MTMVAFQSRAEGEERESAAVFQCMTMHIVCQGNKKLGSLAIGVCSENAGFT